MKIWNANYYNIITIFNIFKRWYYISVNIFYFLMVNIDTNGYYIDKM